MATGLVSVVADDGTMQDYSLLMPILNKYSIRANCAIISDLIGKSGYMGASQISELESMGWEMLCHSKTHSAPLHTLSGQRLREEIVDAKSQLIDIGINTRHFCYPWGSRSRAVKQLIAPHFDCAIRAGGGPNSFYYDGLAVNRCSLDGVDIRNAERVAECKKQVLALVDMPLWIVYMVHPAKSVVTREVAGGISDLMEHILECGIPIVTITEATALIASRIDGKHCRDVRVLRSRAIELTKDELVRCFPPRHIQRVQKGFGLIKATVSALRAGTRG